MPEHVKFNISDVTLIVILWSYELASIWVGDLSRYTFYLVFVDEDLQSAYYDYIDTGVFLVACGAIVIVGFLIDAYGHKFVVSIIGLCLCTSTPFIAVFTCITKYAPGAVIMFLMVVTLFVVCPATYGLIFNQKPHPVRTEVRLLVSFCECSVTFFGKYLAFICIPEEVEGTDKELWIVIVLWVIVATFLVTLITFVERTKKHVTGDFVNEKGIKELFSDLRSDMKQQPSSENGRNIIHVTFFILLLLPALSIASLDGALSNANSDDVTETQSPQLKHIMFTVQVLVIPFMELIISLVPLFSERIKELVVLVWVHFINIAVISLFIYRLDTLPDKDKLESESRDKRDVGETFRSFLCVNESACGSPLKDGPGFAAWLFLSMCRDEIEIRSQPPIFEGGETPTSKLNRYGFILNSYKITGGYQRSIQFTYTLLNPKSTTGSKVFTLTENKLHFYVITSDNSSHIEMKYIPGPELTATKSPRLIFLNAYMTKATDGLPNVSDLIIRLNSSERKFDQSYSPPNAYKYAIWELPVAWVEVSLIRKALRNVTDSGTFLTEPFNTYLAYLYKVNKLAVIKFKKIPPVTEAPPTPTGPDAIQKTVYALFGAGLGVASVGYTHFFWVESPLRLRAFLYALYRVSTEMLRWIARKVVGESFTRSVAIGFLVLQIVTAIWHLGLSWIFHSRIQIDMK